MEFAMNRLKKLITPTNRKKELSMNISRHKISSALKWHCYLFHIKVEIL